MSGEIYLCVRCGGPICFPRGHLMHIGTGWRCWQHQLAEEGPPPDFNLDDLTGFIGEVPEEVRGRLVARSTFLLHEWLETGRRYPLIRFLREQLKAHRGDVLQEFLRQLARVPPQRAATLVGHLMATKEWRRLAGRVLRRRSPRRSAA